MAPDTLETPTLAAQWLRARVTGALRSDSRQVRPGDGLLAWPGAATDARRHVRAALDAGASACLVERDGVEAFGLDDPRVRACRGLKAATGPIAAAYFDHPSEALDMVAITGTNGKTSTAWWLAQALTGLRQQAPCGVVGTLGIGAPPTVDPNGLTTPDPVLLQTWLRRFVDQGYSACAIEASSIGLEERRLDGTRIRVAVFTNFTQDHLDYHGNMASYWLAKARLFDWPGLQAAVVNIDDPQGQALAELLASRPLDLWTVSRHQTARLMARDLRQTADGLCFEVVDAARPGAVHAVTAPVVGDYNASNLLCVLGALRALGLGLAAAAAACGQVSPVPGRMDRVSVPGQPMAVIDYAHTPDALDQALRALRPLAAQRGGALWCVFGCGGDRDAGKRPLMAAVAERAADHLVLTSDNPRSEDPEAILAQMLAGLQDRARATVQPDRAQAITQTLARAAAADVVLVAGKGHEAYQEVAGVRSPFSDQAQAQAALRQRAAAEATP